MPRFFVILFLLLIIPVKTYAGRSISLPFELLFNSETEYADIVRITGGGGRHVHEPAGGWNGSGAAKFFPPTSADSYCGLGWFENFGSSSTRQLNVRVLVYFGDQMDSTSDRENKFIIFNRNTQSPQDRVMTVIDDYYKQWLTFSAAINASSHWYPYQIGDGAVWYPNNSDTFRIGSGQREQEWICIELQANLDEGRVKTIITTADGEFREKVHVERQITSTGGFWDSIDMIGGYWNNWGGTGNEPGRYLKLSHLKIDNKYIGPPAGFIGGSSNLPFTSSFENGDWSEWNGGQTANMSVINSSPNSGNYCARATLTANTHSDNYLDYYFGDHPSYGGDKVEELYLQVYSKFSPGYIWPNDDQKIALLNLTDGQSSQRRYQVGIMVNSEGQYYIEHTDIDDWRFYGLSQNQGITTSVRAAEWDKLKLYVKLNTPGMSNGIVKFWINDILKLSYTNVNIRENTSFGMSKLILSSYAVDFSGSNGFQYYDDWTLSQTDPENGETPNLPTNLRVTMQ